MEDMRIEKERTREVVRRVLRTMRQNRRARRNGTVAVAVEEPVQKQTVQVKRPRKSSKPKSNAGHSLSTTKAAKETLESSSPSCTASDKAKEKKIMSKIKRQMMFKCSKRRCDTHSSKPARIFRHGLRVHKRFRPIHLLFKRLFRKHLAYEV